MPPQLRSKSFDAGLGEMWLGCRHELLKRGLRDKPICRQAIGRHLVGIKLG